MYATNFVASYFIDILEEKSTLSGIMIWILIFCGRETVCGPTLWHTFNKYIMQSYFLTEFENQEYIKQTEREKQQCQGILQNWCQVL